MTNLRCLLAATTAMSVLTAMGLEAKAEKLDLTLRYQTETSKDSGRFHRVTRDESWDPKQTAIVVCDVWDYHHCLNAVRRLNEFAPRLEKLLQKARAQGVTIIHSPSSCMNAYTDHPARKRAIGVGKVDSLPKDITSWCSRIPSEEQAVYPIDQSDGGEDDDPKEHAEWAAKLKAMGRNPKGPWKKQLDTITIDAKRDYISDRGDEVWSILERRGIKNVVLAGVHVNMCVLGRPFGLRQMVRNGKNAVLIRDMTDAMYNPKRWPYVSHFTGNDLIVSHIERYVCPTITSDQFLGGQSFQYKHDTRPHVVMVIAEDEYETAKSLPKFAVDQLGKHFKVSVVFGNDKERHNIVGFNEIKNADVVLVSVRRRALPSADMKILREYVKAGKPIVGIRTASHAFSLRGKPSPDGTDVWEAWDAEIFGGNYTGHYGNSLKSKVTLADVKHDILSGLGSKSFPQAGSLYKTAPLAKGATALAHGAIEGEKPEPTAWTFKRADGGRSFYTSLGHVGDFKNPEFLKLLVNGIRWAAEMDPMTASVNAGDNHWAIANVPAKINGVAWLRCVVRLPEHWVDQLRLVTTSNQTAWINGHSVSDETINPKWIEAGDANLLVIRATGRVVEAPLLQSGDRKLALAGRWQMRRGDDSSWSNMPLPAKFGTSTDIVFEP